MEFLDSIANIGVGAAIGGVIAFAIQVIKTLIQKLPWKWTKSIPGAAWITLSVAMGIGVALYMGYNVLDDVVKETLPIPELVKIIITGVGIGGSSKVVYDVAAPVGAKLTAIKKEQEVKSAVAETQVAAVKEQTVCVEPIPAATPVIAPVTAMATPVTAAKSEVILAKKVSSKPDFVIIDGKIYEI